MDGLCRSFRDLVLGDSQVELVYHSLFIQRESRVVEVGEESDPREDGIPEPSAQIDPVFPESCKCIGTNGNRVACTVEEHRFGSIDGKGGCGDQNGKSYSK